MYNRTNNHYYSNAITNAYTKQGQILLKYYNSGQRNKFFTEYNTNFLQLKLQYTNIDDTSKIIKSFIDITNNLLILNNTLQQQIDDLITNGGSGGYQPTLFENSVALNVPNTNLTQDTTLKLVYVQYLIMFDIRLTNGIFIESNLAEAQKVLNDNGGHLNHSVSYIQ